MKQTENFFLKLFEGTDKFDYKVVNENWQKIDDAIDELLNGGNIAILPTMTIEKTETGYTITTKDAKSSQTFEIFNGKTAYQYAQDGGYPGTEEEFTSNIAKSGSVGKELDRLSTEVAAGNARIDQMIALPEGSTALDAEVIDIRTGANGVTYPTAGEAVREQIRAIEENVYYIENVDEPLEQSELVSGYIISSSTGNIPTQSSNYLVACYPLTNKIKEIVVNGYHSAEHLCVMGFYKADTIEGCTSETLIGTTALYTKQKDTFFTVPANATMVCVSIHSLGLNSLKVNATKKADAIFNKYEGLGEQVAELKDTTIAESAVLTVGANGDFATIGEALTEMTKRHPLYKSGGVNCEIKILSGTTISEQICVVGTDLSYIKITSEDAEVPVNVDGFSSKGLNSHDLRSNAGAFFGGENGARLPTISCLFKVAQNTNNIAVVAYFANRGSSGLVLSNCGFDGFNDGVISNNEASVTIREGIARNMTRWGIHARHNGEISARSADLTNCGDTAAYADRIGDLDVREAILDGSKVALMGYNTSRINANGCNMTNVGVDGGAAIIQSQSGSTVNCQTAKIVNPLTNIFSVAYGGIITAHLATVTDENSRTLFSQAKNTLTAHGIIWSNL